MFKRSYRAMGAAFTVGAMTTMSSVANATTTTTGASSTNFSSIARNITTSIQDLPGMLSAVSYLFGILIGVLGIMKIKDHVENPTQTPLKDGAIRLAAGGALFALPIVYQAMLSTIQGGDSGDVSVAQLNAVSMGLTSTTGTP